jgi:hypothetical protein
MVVVEARSEKLTVGEGGDTKVAQSKLSVPARRLRK